MSASSVGTNSCSGGSRKRTVIGRPSSAIIHGLEVALLHRLELGERLLALLERVGADHLADGGDTVSLEEHMLGAAEADALGAELDRLRGIVRVIGVGADAPDGDTCPPSP